MKTAILILALCAASVQAQGLRQKNHARSGEIHPEIMDWKIGTYKNFSRLNRERSGATNVNGKFTPSSKLNFYLLPHGAGAGGNRARRAPGGYNPRVGSDPRDQVPL